MVGMFGALTAAGTARFVDWRTSYLVGGGLGLVLLVLRIRVAESSLFERAKTSEHTRGDLALLFRDGGRRRRLLGLVVVGAPIWFIVGVLITFAPEFAAAFGTQGKITAGDTVFWFYAGVVPGDLVSGTLSQRIGSRKRAVGAFLVLEAIAIAVFLSARGLTPATLMAVAAFAGFSTGYWAVLVTMAAEQFGTNLRATAATSIPNLVRATAVPVTLAFGALRGPLGMTSAAALVGALVMVVAFAALRTQRETFGDDLDFVER
jgi:MFS family permease